MGAILWSEAGLQKMREIYEEDNACYHCLSFLSCGRRRQYCLEAVLANYSPTIDYLDYASEIGLKDGEYASRSTKTAQRLQASA